MEGGALKHTQLGTLAGPLYWAAYWAPCLLAGTVARAFVRHRPRERGVRVLAVLAPEHIGDLVFTIPLVRALRHRYPRARLIVAAGSPAVDVIQPCPYVDEVIVWGHPGVGAAIVVGWALRRTGADMVIVPRADPSGAAAALAAVVSGAPRRVGLADCRGLMRRLARLQAAPFLSELVYPPAGARHETERRLALAWHLGATDGDAKPETWVTQADERAAAAFLTRIPPDTWRVAFGIGASAPNRRWPAERFAALINRLATLAPIAPVVIGGLEDGPELQRIRGLARVPVYALPRATVRESIAVLRGCALFVGNDSGPSHLASANDLPTIVISNHPRGAEDLRHASHPAKCGPACVVSTVLRPSRAAESACRAGCGADRPHCILAVSVEAVLQAVLELGVPAPEMPP